MTTGTLTAEQIRQVARSLWRIPLEERKYLRLSELAKARQQAQALRNAQTYFTFIAEDRQYFKFDSLGHYRTLLRSHIERQEPNFDFEHPKVKEVLNAASKYFFGINGEYDLNKGILLCGHPGCGKSFLLNVVFKLNPTRPLVIHNAVEIAFEYQAFGSKVFNNYRFNTEQSPNKFGVRHRYRVFDDIGTETTQKHFGSEANVIQSLIELRYASSALTFGTTNLKISKIAEVYGPRVASRFKEMFNIVDMSGMPDYRIKNN